MMISLLNAALLASAVLPASADWERFYSLRDTSGLVRDNEPSGGYRVTPVHSMVLPNKEVLVLGWARTKEFKCGGKAEFGVSFTLDPAEMVGQGERDVLEITPLDEKPKVDNSKEQDVLTYGGHTALADGRKFIFGGARYDLKNNNWATGLNYARIYDSTTGTFENVDEPSPFGDGWYPTAVVLPDQRVLVAAGFERCCNGHESAAMAFFDPERHDNRKSSPWQLMLYNKDSRQDLTPTSKDYTRLFVLPEPIVVNGLVRQVAALGKAGRYVFLNTDPNLRNEDRFADLPNNQRPNKCGGGTTASLLANGKLMMMGGCSKTTLDVYNPKTDVWNSVDTGIVRNHGSSLLLPNGNVVLINGENNMNQDNGKGNQGDTRVVQVYDPFTNEIESLTDDIEPADGLDSDTQGAFRGYHNVASLLHDGRIITGGGRHKEGSIGCEHASIRLYTPSYLDRGNGRPTMSIVEADSSDQGLPALRLDDPTSTIRVTYTSNVPLLKSNGKPGKRSGAALVALSANTHAYDQAQRYVPLRYDVDSEDPNTLIIYAPDTPVGYAGVYMLALVQEDGAFSEAESVQLLVSEGKWKRTVIYVQADLEEGDILKLRGGHTSDLKAFYDNTEKEEFIHANMLGRGSKVQDKMAWRGGTELVWSVNKDERPDLVAKHTMITNTPGGGVDPENTMEGQNWYKLDMYMKVDTADDSDYRNWFQFKLFKREFDEETGTGNRDREGKTGHVTIDGPTPPAENDFHWARKGSVNIVTFGKPEATIYNLNEAPLKAEHIPTMALGGAARAPSDFSDDYDVVDYYAEEEADEEDALASQLNFGALGAAAAGGTLLVLGAAFVVVRRRRQAVTAPEKSEAVVAATGLAEP